MHIGLAIIVNPKDKTILIAKRPNDVHLAGFWEFPGGKFVVGESPSECAIREAREEVGLDVAAVAVWPPIEHTYPERSVTLHPVLCRPITTEARPKASTDIAWVGAADLAFYEFPEANASIIARLLDELSSPAGGASRHGAI